MIRKCIDAKKKKKKRKKREQKKLTSCPDLRHKLAYFNHVFISSCGVKTRECTLSIRCHSSTLGWQPCKRFHHAVLMASRRPATSLYWITSSSSDNICTFTIALLVKGMSKISICYWKEIKTMEYTFLQRIIQRIVEDNTKIENWIFICLFSQNPV